MYLLTYVFEVIRAQVRTPLTERNLHERSFNKPTSISVFSYFLILFVLLLLPHFAHAVDGSGSAVVSPNSAAAGSSGNDFTFTYTLKKTWAMDRSS